jgi:hypothetical protein
MKPLIPYIIDHGFDILIGIAGLVSGLVYGLRPNWLGNYNAERDEKKSKWFGVIFTSAGIALLIYIIVGYLNSN